MSYLFHGHPEASSPTLILAHPTPLEITQTNALSSISWAGALTKTQHVEIERQLASHLADGDGITHWILTQSQAAPDRRPILASCETIPKRCLVKEADGVVVREGLVYGVAGVFCDPAFRRRGYASRMLRELAGVLRRRGAGGGVRGLNGVGSVLFSDIGRKFYADLGWAPFPSKHIELPASQFSHCSPEVATKAILAEDVEKLCADDEALLRDSIAAVSASERLFAVVPDHHTMVWHHKKEDFVCQRLFGKQPDVKGALVGKNGNRTWAIWTRTFYGAINDPDAENRLYILRLVIESPDSKEPGEQVGQLKAVLEAAQNQAAEWKLDHVEVWNPDENVRRLLELTGIEHRLVERETEAIPSLLWFGDASGIGNRVEWAASEKFAWC